MKTVLAAPAISVALLVGLAVPSQAASPSLTLSKTTLPANGATTVTVTGASYLVPPHAPNTQVFGGVYVFFGWVANAGNFGPAHRDSTSNNGTFANTYAYPGDGGGASTRDDGSGLVRLVSFTDSGESGTATDFHMDAAGNWTTTLRIPGPTFTAKDPISGADKVFDCRVVRCGVFTIGAHGKASATNEVFTPVTFAPEPVGAGAQPPVTSAVPKASSAPKTTAPSTVTAPTTAVAAPVSEGPGPEASASTPVGVAPATSAPSDDVRAVNVRNVSDKSNGGSAALIGVAVLAVLVAAGAGGWIWRRHTSS